MNRPFEKLPQFTVIRDTYTVDGVLGEGAFGVVYKVRHKFLGIQALKVFHPEKLSQQNQDELLNEAFILSKITHPNVVRVFDANHFDWRGQVLSYVAMEYVPVDAQ
jgi:serine/threonine-protein kinase